ncbi:MAG: pilus assembly protein [Planctomycetes bacterium]|nr:pilus assembly protein [Planctomycetota bacterium]
MRLRHHDRVRRGLTLAETGLVITALLMLVMGTIDLGTAVFRYHALSQAARQGVRQVVVHGSLAPSGWNGGPWGPPASYPSSNPYTVTASDTSDQIASAVRPYLSNMDPDQVTVTAQWMDSSNQAEKRVKVTVSTTWQPLLLFVFGNTTINLSASSMMPIAH